MGSSEGVFPQTEVWALGKAVLWVFIYSQPKGRGQKATWGSSGFLVTTYPWHGHQQPPQAQTSLDTAFGCRIKCDPTRNRLETCRDVYDVLTLLHKPPPSPAALGLGFLAPSAQPPQKGSQFTRHVQTVPGCSPVLHDQPGCLHSLHLSSPSPNIFYPQPL